MRLSVSVHIGCDHTDRPRLSLVRLRFVSFKFSSLVFRSQNRLYPKTFAVTSVALKTQVD